MSLMSTLFGTDGIRGTVGISPFTYSELHKLGKAIGQWAQKRFGNTPTMLLGHDTRNSSDWVLNCLQSGLLLSPIDIYHAGIIPTPAVLKLIHTSKHFDFGIMLSASHNPYQDNGIKLIDSITGKCSDADEEAIMHIYQTMSNESYTNFGSVHHYPEAIHEYQSRIIKRCKDISFSDMKIVLDCAEGAAYQAAPSIFESLGATVIPIHDNPSGTNINAQCGALYPKQLSQAVIAHHADFGCAFDGDGDRMIMVNRKGDIQNGDNLLALLSEHEAYKYQTTIVGTIMANQGLESYLQARNKTLIRTPVGDRWVSDYLLKNQLLLGGEQSGHIILADYLPSGDGIMTAIRVIEAVQQTENWNMDTFTTYPQRLINIPVQRKKDLNEPAIIAIIEKYEKQLGDGRVYIRYSGTEPVLRIMVEDHDTHSVHAISTGLAQDLTQAFQ